MFLAVGETHGTKNTKKRISPNNLFLLSSEGGREEKELKRLGALAPGQISRGGAETRRMFAKF